MALYRRSKVWWVEFSFHGQRVRRSTGTSSKTKAPEFERQLRGRLYDQHVLGHPEEMTLGEAIDGYTDTVLIHAAAECATCCGARMRDGTLGRSV